MRRTSWLYLRFLAGNARLGEGCTDLNKMIQWTMIGAALAMVIWVVASSHAKAMEICQQGASYATCVRTIQ